MKKLLPILLILIVIILATAINYYGITLYKVASSSMEPTIKIGSLVLVRKETSYKVGDIVSYKTLQNNSPITHRIINISKNQGRYFFHVKGDNNEHQDPYLVSETELIGKVIFMIPFLGCMPEKLDDWKYILYFLPIPAGLISGKLFKKFIDLS